MAVPPTSPKCSRNFPTSGSRSRCSFVSISSCMMRMFIEVERKIVGNVRVIISPLPSRYHLLAEYLRGAVNPYDTHQFLKIIPIAVIKGRFDDGIFINAVVVLGIPNKMRPCRNKITQRPACHARIIPYFEPSCANNSGCESADEPVDESVDSRLPLAAWPLVMM